MGSSSVNRTEFKPNPNNHLVVSGQRRQFSTLPQPLHTPAFSDALLSAAPARSSNHVVPAAMSPATRRRPVNHRRGWRCITARSRPPLLQGFGLRLHLSDIRRRFTSAQVTPDSLRPFPDPPSVSPPRLAPSGNAFQSNLQKIFN